MGSNHSNGLVMFKSRGKSLYEAVKGIGRIAERRHTAISVYTNRAATERHWMPEGSDCPYPEVLYSDLHDATTFERYQYVCSPGIASGQ